MHRVRSPEPAFELGAFAAPLADLPDQRAFERLLGALSESLSGVGEGDLAGCIEAILHELVECLGASRCTFAEFVAGDYLNVLCSAGTPQLEALARGRFPLQVRWFLDDLRRGRIVALSALPEDLPAEALREAEHCRQSGLRAHLSIPVNVAGRVSSVLTVAIVGRTQSWSDVTMARLQIIANLLGGSVALARAEEEALQLRQRIWHADRLQRVSTLTAAIAHELNQPLAAILSNAQAGQKYLAKGEATAEATQEIFEAVVREGKRAAETIRTMRALMRHDESRRERVDLGAALGSAMRLLNSEFVASDVHCETRFEADCVVMADKVQTEQVGLNLLLNAIKAVRGEVPARRTVRLEVSRQANGRVRMAVEDTGTGIAPDDMDAIFEPFWTTRRDGLGLGLAICRSIVEAHGGRIWAESNPQGGAVFSVELPAADAPLLSGLGGLVQIRPGLDDAPEERPAVREAVVCVVDDDDEVRNSLLRLLKGAGWACAGYTSAEAFLADPPGQDILCLLVDVQMPGLSGPQLHQRLLERGAAPPVIFISGRSDVAAGVTAMKRGAADFLEKPVDGEVLLAALQRAVERHAGEREGARVLDALKERIARLSPREREIMNHVVRGRLNKQIAADLLIAEQTVKQHRGRVMEKMGVRSVADLVRACEAAGVVAEMSLARPPVGLGAHGDLAGTVASP